MYKSSQYKVIFILKLLQDKMIIQVYSYKMTLFVRRFTDRSLNLGYLICIFSIYKRRVIHCISRIQKLYNIYSNGQQTQLSRMNKITSEFGQWLQNLNHVFLLFSFLLRLTVLPCGSQCLMVPRRCKQIALVEEVVQNICMVVDMNILIYMECCVKWYAMVKKQ